MAGLVIVGEIGQGAVLGEAGPFSVGEVNEGTAKATGESTDGHEWPAD